MKPFWKHAPEIAARLAAGRLLVTLDFDGTLAALAETPGQASLRPEFKAALRALAARPGVSVFILSGRALPNVRRLVGLRRLYYGGNHGMEIQGPGLAWRDAGAARARLRLAAAAADLRERFPEGTGILVEYKTFSVSVHYRALKPAYRAGFFARMRALAAAGGGLRWTRGHKVFELRPAGAPHKGDAVLRLGRKLAAAAALAVGDDLTDEDMFAALAARGVTVRVGRKARSAAEYFLPAQADVLSLLRFATAAREGGEHERS
ncbi:MAG TPA: trehalose-phosphatase [Elusimicrobia bacterium]|nr:MAG: trehalose-phosphatase [Elusimicrobia bacterium GWA2_64_40]HAN04813.1 trehalose-phosphatase [Elusimicrobiota bacterium]HAU89318.1 trehalose-phosphatase [Elusimicrobiota bacterium]